jgi:hypothetical protein
VEHATTLNPHVYDIDVYRDGRWWMVKIPEIDGLTQGRWLGEAESMARSYIAVSTDIPVSDVDVRTVKVTSDSVPEGFLRRVWRIFFGDLPTRTTELGVQTASKSSATAPDGR